MELLAGPGLDERFFCGHVARLGILWKFGEGKIGV